MTQKLDLLNSLINTRVMLQRAEKLGLTATDNRRGRRDRKMRSP